MGLTFVAFAFWIGRLGNVIDRALVTLSAIGSLTWNTETTSAFLLVGVGLIWVVLAVRLLTLDTGSNTDAVRPEARFHVSMVALVIRR